MVSSGLVKMAETAKRTSASMRGVNGTLAQSYDEIKRRISELESTIRKSNSVSQIRAARQELERLQRSAARSPGNLRSGTGFFGGLYSQLRTIVPMLSLVGAIGLGTSVIGAGARQERDVTSLGNFVGRDNATGVYQNIRKDALSSPFNIESLLGVNRALISAGVNAEKARKDTMNLANAIAATGGTNDELMRMAVNMQQIANNGKAMGLDIRQFAYAGINIYGILGAVTGKTKDQLQDMDITYDLLSKALERAGQQGGAYFNAMNNIMKTTWGQAEVLKGKFVMAGQDIGIALRPVYEELLQIGFTITDEVLPAIVDMIGWIKENWSWIGLLITTIGGAFLAYKTYMMGVILYTKIWTAVQWLLNAAMDANPIGLVIAAIAALVAGIVWAWNHFEGFRRVVLGLWEVFKQVFSNIGAFFKRIFSPIFEAIQAFKEGRYLDAAKAVGKLMINLSPVGMIAQGVAFAAEGGFTKGVSEAWNRGADLAKKKPEKDTQAAAIPGGGKLANAVSPGVSADDSVKGITSGGPRVININGVKFTDKIEIHQMTSRESVTELERMMEQMFLRILNSGAAVQ